VGARYQQERVDFAARLLASLTRWWDASRWRYAKGSV